MGGFEFGEFGGGMYGLSNATIPSSLIAKFIVLTPDIWCVQMFYEK
jgi:hypothetical protein